MSINGISGNNYNAYTQYDKKVESAKAAESTSTDKNSTGVVYEASEEGKKASQADRSAIVKQLKADQESREQQLVDLVKRMMGQQGVAIGQADDMWKFLASGDYEVDPEVKAQAQEDISEDGYWGVKQTSQRIFDFAMALSGGDAETMEDMRAAFEKGFGEATKSWGKELPEISQQTYDATQKLFDEYAQGLEQVQ